MSESKALSPIADEDYGAIEAAVMETQRGRWFLSEYARRNRNADTNVLLGAIERLENAVSREREADRMDRLRFDLVEMARAITSTKREIAAIRPGEGAPSDLGVASEALDGIVVTTERATSDILEAAENVQEAAWTLREDGAREDLCDELDRRATEIYTHCSFQDLTAQRTKRIIETLRFLEGRINAMIDIWGASVDDVDAPQAGGAEPGARRDGLGAQLEVFSGLDQESIDDVIVGASRSVAILEPEIEPRAPRAATSVDEIAWEGDETAFTELEPLDGHVEALADATDVAFVEEPAFEEPAFEELAFEEPETLAVDADAADPVEPEVENAADDVDAEALGSDDDASFDIDAFAEIDALSTREKLARFS